MGPSTRSRRSTVKAPISPSTTTVTPARASPAPVKKENSGMLTPASTAMPSEADEDEIAIDGKRATSVISATRRQVEVTVPPLAVAAGMKRKGRSFSTPFFPQSVELFSQSTQPLWIRMTWMTRNSPQNHRYAKGLPHPGRLRQRPLQRPVRLPSRQPAQEQRENKRHQWCTSLTTRTMILWKMKLASMKISKVMTTT